MKCELVHLTDITYEPIAQTHDNTLEAYLADHSKHGEIHILQRSRIERDRCFNEVVTIYSIKKDLLVNHYRVFDYPLKEGIDQSRFDSNFIIINGSDEDKICEFLDGLRAYFRVKPRQP